MKLVKVPTDNGRGHKWVNPDAVQFIAPCLTISTVYFKSGEKLNVDLPSDKLANLLADALKDYMPRGSDSESSGVPQYTNVIVG